MVAAVHVSENICMVDYNFSINEELLLKESELKDVYAQSGLCTYGFIWFGIWYVSNKLLC